jgi:hypothetical protein
MAHNHTEHVQEELHEHAHGAKEKWIGWAALTAAILAALAAIAGSLASGNLTNSMRTQMVTNDTWSYYQAKSIKSTQYATSGELLKASGKTPPEDWGKKIEEYKGEMKELEKKAKESEALSEKHLEAHETFELAVTLFHVAIAVAAVGVLTKSRWFWYVAMVGGAAGAAFLAWGYMQAPKHHAGGHEPAGQANAAPAGSAPAAHE